MDALIITGLAALGLCLGSFINALVWRLHEQDWLQSLEAKKKLSAKQTKRRQRLSIRSGRSMCPHCEHELAWLDLVPVISWVGLGGRCRYCRKPISIQYPLVEVLMALVMVGSYLYWPYDLTAAGLALLGLWLAMTVLLVALLVYDARWYLLPNKLVYPLIGLALVYGVVSGLAIQGLVWHQLVVELGLGVLSVGGLYFVLHAMSDGKWVGFGDVRLGVAMGLALGWQLGLLAVFAANLIGMVVILPGLLSRRLGPKSRIPFGPFLIAGLMVAIIWGQVILDWYFGYFLAI